MEKLLLDVTETAKMLGLSCSTILGINSPESISPIHGGSYIGLKSALAIVDIYNKGLKNKLDPSKVFYYKGGKNESK